jgi:WD40 repeat protein
MRIAWILACLSILPGFLLAPNPLAARPQMPPPPTIERMVVSPDGKLLAVVWRNPSSGVAELQNARNGRGAGVLLHLSPQAGGAAELKFDGGRFIAAPRFIPPWITTSLAFSPDCTRLAAGNSQGQIGIWDTARTGTEKFLIESKEGNSRAAVHSLVFHADGKSVVAIADDGNLKRWDTATGNLLTTIALGDPQQLLATALTPDGKLAASAHRNAMIHLWNVETGALARSFSLAGSTSVMALRLSKDGKQLAAGISESTTTRRALNLFRPEYSSQSKTIVMNALNGQRLIELADTFADMQFSASGNSLVTCKLGGADGVRYWSLTTGKTVLTVGDESPASQIIPASDGVHLFRLSPQGVSAWNIKSGERVFGR